VFSVNVVFARLIDLIGPAKVVETAARAGIVTPLSPFHSLALGAQEVTVLELASAYGTFATGGVHVAPVFVTAIEDAAGVNIFSATVTETPALDRAVAETVTAALAEVVQRGTGQQARIGRAMAGKTGTSQNHHDAWFVGYTPDLVAAVWVGFPDALRPLEFPATPFSITGGTWPANIWARFASAALAGVPYSQIRTLDDGDSVTVEVDLSTGFLAGPLCPGEHVHTLRLPGRDAPSVICPIHNPTGIGLLPAGIAPDVIGFDLQEAVALLTRAGYQTSLDWADGGPLEQGVVFAQDPAPGAAHEAGSLVRITVAGPEPGSTVPAVLGLPVGEARRRLEADAIAYQQLVLAESDPDDAARRSGLVWKQEPAAGSPVSDRVTIWVNP